MFLSRRMMWRMAVIAGLVLMAWTAFRRVDAVVDKWNDFYHTALGVHIIRGFFENDSVSREFDREWDTFDRNFHRDERARPPDRRPQESPASPLDDIPRASDDDFDRRFSEQWQDFDSEIQAARRRMQVKVPTHRTPPSHAARPAAPVEPPEGDPEYKRYEERSLVSPVPNPPVAFVAEQYSKGYYVGLWNFLWHARVIPLVGSIVGTLFWLWWWRRRQRMLKTAQTQRRVEEELDDLA